MKLAVFTDTFLPSMNGIVTSVLNSSMKLADRGHKILIFTSDMGKKSDFHYKNIKVEYYRPLNIIPYPDFKVALPQVRIVKKIMKFKPDVIHSHMPTFLGWEAVLCSKIFDIPMVGTYHTLLPDFLDHLPFPDKINRSDVAKYFTWSYTRRYYNKCNVVITPSDAMKKVLKDHGVKDVKAVSNGVRLDKFSPKKKKTSGNMIIYVGRVSYEKNIDVVIKAFRIVTRKDKKAKLVIIGGGPDLQKLKKETKPEKQIIFKGPIPNSKLCDEYSNADMFATASTIETEGIVILEAMACGLPVLG